MFFSQFMALNTRISMFYAQINYQHYILRLKSTKISISIKLCFILFYNHLVLLLHRQTVLQEGNSVHRFQFYFMVYKQVIIILTCIST